MEHQTERLSPFFAERLLLSGQASIEIPGWLQASDPQPFSGEGPMAGLLGGLEQCSHPALLLMPIDSPGFPVLPLLQALELLAREAEVVGFLDPGGRAQWLPGAFRSELVHPLRQALVEGERSLGRWLRGRRVSYLPWRDEWGPAEPAFWNLNTPEEALEAGYSLPGLEH